MDRALCLQLGFPLFPLCEAVSLFLRFLLPPAFAGDICSGGTLLPVRGPVPCEWLWAPTEAQGPACLALPVTSTSRAL